MDSHDVDEDVLSAASSFSPPTLFASPSNFYPVLQQKGGFPALSAFCMFMLWRHKCSFILLPWFGLNKAAVGG